MNKNGDRTQSNSKCEYRIPGGVIEEIGCSDHRVIINGDTRKLYVPLYIGGYRLCFDDGISIVAMIHLIQTYISKMKENDFPYKTDIEFRGNTVNLFVQSQRTIEVDILRFKEGDLETEELYLLDTPITTIETVKETGPYSEKINGGRLIGMKSIAKMVELIVFPKYANIDKFDELKYLHCHTIGVYTLYNNPQLRINCSRMNID